MDSITEARSSDPSSARNAIINKVKLLLNEDIECKRVVVLVEGQTDVEFVKNVLCSHVVSVETNGKKHFQLLLDVEELKNKRVIAIRDRDYSDVNLYPERLFAYDHCALELMILSHPIIRKKLGALYIEPLDADKFPLEIMRAIAPYSLLRQNNEKEALGLTLENGVLSGLNKQSDRLPDMRKLLLRVLDDDIKCNEYLSAARNLSDLALWDITNGHDICSVLGKCSYLENKCIGEKGYVKLMLLLYRKEDFRSTELYINLNAYQKKEKIIIVE